MAYRLKEIIDKRYLSDVTNNIIDMTRVGIMRKTIKIPITHCGKKILFESQFRNHMSIVISNNDSYNESIYSLEQLLIHGFVALYGYTSGISILTNNKTNMNTVNEFYHILFDGVNKRFTVFNPIKQVIVVDIDISSLINYVLNTKASFYFGFRSGNGMTSIVNPDVESFKYPPFISYDNDLYTVVEKNPTVLPNKNILNIL